MLKQRNFFDLLHGRWKKELFVCVGLDSDPAKIPVHITSVAPDAGYAIYRFNVEIVDATHDLVGCYKPNFAFYEEHGDSGIRALMQTVLYIRQVAPDVPIILDHKAADIGNTNSSYLKAALNYGVDAMTVHPYLGGEAMQPFLSNPDFGVIVLCRTSNPGAAEFQDQLTFQKPEVIKALLRSELDPEACEWEDLSSPERGQGLGIPLYHMVAMNVERWWNTNKNCGLVMGATYPKEIAKVRSFLPDMPFLLPGVGKQGGDAVASATAACDSKGQGFVTNSSSGIIYPSHDANFAEIARTETFKLTMDINQGRKAFMAAQQK